MTADFWDGFDHYVTVLDKEWIPIQIAGGQIQAGQFTGRFGTGACFNNGNDQRNGIYRSITQATTLWASFATYMQTLPVSTDSTLLAFRDSGTVQIDIRMTPAGILKITRNGTVLATGSTTYFINQWNNFEFSTTINTSTGTALLKVNGSTEFNLTGLNNQATANAYANEVQVFGAGSASGGQYYMDDFVVGNNLGTKNTTNPGDQRVFTSYATGAGTTTQLTASTGSNYTTVDETSANGDTDYVYGASAGLYDTYAITDLPTSATSVTGVQISMYARKDDAGTRGILPVIRTASTDYEVGSNKNLTGSYKFYTYQQEVNPNTTNNWTPSEVNGLEAGPKIKT